MSTRVIVVTGGAQGIGLAIARRFLAESWAAVVFDADAEALDEAATGLSALGDVLPVCGDVMLEGDVAAAFEAAAARYGRVDALINNAGIGIGRALAELSLAEWNRVIGVNLTGAFLCTRAAAPWLRLTRGGIVNIASTRARQSEANTEAYAASKGGLVALTHASAVSLGPEIRVNCILPVGSIRRPGRRHARAARSSGPQPTTPSTPADVWVPLTTWRPWLAISSATSADL